MVHGEGFTQGYKGYTGYKGYCLWGKSVSVRWLVWLMKCFRVNVCGGNVYLVN